MQFGSYSFTIQKNWKFIHEIELLSIYSFEKIEGKIRLGEEFTTNDVSISKSFELAVE